jgi:2-dehydropantoate 2-reductase
LWIINWLLYLQGGTVQERWPRIAVMGAGAVGCYFGGLLARAGAPVTLIGRPRYVEAINRDGLFLDTVQFQQQISIAASTDVSVTRDAGIVLFCVKTFATEEASKSLASHLAPGVVVISLQNGVDNVERMYSAAHIDAIPAVVYVAVAMSAPGRVKHSGRGDLIVGHLLEDGCRPDLASLSALFTRAGIPCRVSGEYRG